MHQAAAATLFCHLLFVYLEQITKHVSSKAKNKSGGWYRRNPNKPAAAWATSTTVYIVCYLQMEPIYVVLHITLETS
jgi:hypothetical protein